MSQTRHLEIAADLDNLKQVRDFIEETTQFSGLNHERTGELLLAVDEAVTNIIMHGCPGGGCAIELEFRGDPDACTIRIRDNATLFDPTAMPDPNQDTPPWNATLRADLASTCSSIWSTRPVTAPPLTVAMN